MSSAPAYLSGLRLVGRRVVLVGAGRVAGRRVGPLLEAGADVTVIAPLATDLISGLASAGELRWLRRRYRDGDLENAWYVLVATDDQECNQRVSVEAERRQIFCVRSDDRFAATAWTPASGAVDGVQIGVLAGGDPGRSRRIRDELLRQLSS